MTCMAWHEWSKMQLRVCLRGAVLLMLLWLDVANSIKLPSIHWNATNPMFKTSNNDHIIEVNMFDQIDFVCPHFAHSQDDDEPFEYYIIHQVSKQEYDDCNLYSFTSAATRQNSAIMIVNCSSPRERKRFTILFEPFTPLPNVPEYRPGGTYYYITTSTGRQDGITNLHQGACLYKNMRLTMRVCCDTTTTTSTRATVPPNPSPHATRSTPHQGGRGQDTTEESRVRHTDNPDSPPDRGDGPGKGDSDDGNNKPAGDKDKDENEVFNPKQEGLVKSSGRTITCSQQLAAAGLVLTLAFTYPWR